MDLLNVLLLIFPGFSVQGVVIANPLVRFTETTDFLLKSSALKAGVLKLLLMTD